MVEGALKGTTEIHPFSVTHMQRERWIHHPYTLFALRKFELAETGNPKERQLPLWILGCGGAAASHGHSTRVD
jgi:hypothetical protein